MLQPSLSTAVTAHQPVFCVWPVRHGVSDARLWPASSSPLQHRGDEIACWTGAPDLASHRLSRPDSASHWAGETKMAAVAPVAGCSGRAGPDHSVRCGAPARPHCRAVQSLHRSSAAVTGESSHCGEILVFIKLSSASKDLSYFI